MKGLSNMTGLNEAEEHAIARLTPYANGAANNVGNASVVLDAARVIAGEAGLHRGIQAIAAVAVRMSEARAKHPWPAHAYGPYQALGVIEEEVRELAHAVEHETPERARDEALDSIVTALRMWLGEHEVRG